MPIFEALTELVGACPAEYSIIGYVCTVFVLIYLLSCCFKILGSFFNFLISRR